MYPHLIIVLLMAVNSIVPQRQFDKKQHRDSLVKQHSDSLVKKAAAGFMNSSKHIGLSIGTYNNGDEYAYHYGTIDKHKHVLPDNQTVYEIASLTKSFTGILLAQAVVDKKIALNDDVRKYLDGKYLNLVYKGKPVRITDLATHTSGLPKNIPDYPSNLTPNEIFTLYKNYSET